MTIAYFDCFSGVSGDMILGALVDAGLEFDRLREELTKLTVEGYRIERRTVKKHEIAATKIDVLIETPGGHEQADALAHEHDHAHHEHHTHHHDHPHPHDHGHTHAHAHGPARRLGDILQVIERSGLDPAVQHRAASIFDRLAAAEGAMHDMAKDTVYLHEVSGLDAIIDIAGAAIGLHLLGIDEVYASALPLGSGFVRCAHGRMPVPAPGALELLRGVPVYQTETRGELVTPTGAAILTTVAKAFGPMPRMVINRIGYGAGTKDFEEQPNLLRVCIGQKD